LCYLSLSSLFLPLLVLPNSTSPFFLTHLFFRHLFSFPRDLHSFPTRRSSDLRSAAASGSPRTSPRPAGARPRCRPAGAAAPPSRSEEHTSELQSRFELVCRTLLEKIYHSPLGVLFTFPSRHCFTIGH